VINYFARNRETHCSACGLTELLFRTTAPASLRSIFPQCEAVVSARKLAMLRPTYLWSAGVFLAMNIDLPVARRAPIAGSFFMPNKSIWIIYVTEKMSA